MDLNNKTILYYTANTESPVFEQKIIDDLKQKAGDIPIVSVSHKPINLGTNICVGNQSPSYVNEWRQMLIGLKAAKTKYCLTAEADCLYPDDYFKFTPKEDDTMYYYDNIHILWKRHKGFRKKSSVCEGAEICNREFWISRFEPYFGKNLGNEWGLSTMMEDRVLVEGFFDKKDTFTGDSVVSFKTGNGISNKTGIKKGAFEDIPYWGIASDLKAKYLS